MARILLQPNETFEHSHSDSSQTIHVEGDIELTMAGVSRRLLRAEVIDIPAACPHSLKNVGASVAEVACLHRC